MIPSWRWLLIVCLSALPAAAQESSRFPVGRSFKVISISGFDVQRSGITFTVAGESQSNRFVGSGNAGCNTWRATVMLRDDSIEFADITTTRKACAKPRMTSENAFLTTLRSAQRWRTDDKGRLIVEGDAARLLLTADGSDRASRPKPAKKQ
jgi:heat shock protein HslJ